MSNTLLHVLTAGETIYIEARKATLREKVVTALGELNQMVELVGPTPEKKLMVMPKGFLGKENFAEVSSILREFGATYVNAGRESRWVIESKE